MAAPPPSTVADVIGRLESVCASARRSDGVACFARLYLQVTQGVQAQQAQQSFADPRFLERLDVVFAGLFFSALDVYQRDQAATPSAWLPLFAARSQPGIAPLQFVLAGVNAHINRDLPVALVTTFTELGGELQERSPDHADFDRINLLLASVETRIKTAYLTGWLARLDRIVHRFDRIDDVMAMWDVTRARDAAWTNAQTLWALRPEPALGEEFVASLDRMVGFASRGLLTPADSLLQKLSRVFARDASFRT